MSSAEDRAAPPLAVAVDVESDWGGAELRGIREALPRFLELLARHDAVATFFVVGELAEEVRAVLPPESPHEVGSHGLSHRRLDRLPAKEQAHELRESRRRLQALGYAVDGFRAPFLATPPALESMLVDAGYAYDASLGSLYHGLGRRRSSGSGHGSGRGRRATHDEPLFGSLSHGAGRERRATHDEPSFGAGRPGVGSLPRLGGSALRGGLLPFNLTWLRLLHPLGLAARPPRPKLFSLHLHELLDGPGGWPTLPRPLRRLHSLHCGAPAWRMVERVLGEHAGRITSCRSLLSLSPSSSAPARPA